MMQCGVCHHVCLSIHVVPSSSTLKTHVCNMASRLVGPSAHTANANPCRVCEAISFRMLPVCRPTQVHTVWCTPFHAISVRSGNTVFRHRPCPVRPFRLQTVMCRSTVSMRHQRCAQTPWPPGQQSPLAMLRPGGSQGSLLQSLGRPYGGIRGGLGQLPEYWGNFHISPNICLEKPRKPLFPQT